ncbi:hypothetical protein [Burkholderia ubonensis]|nr:hypothetical protein [Burkholderia ubonensis]KVP75234.1 hypothetical protein WJ93_07410 [Burkholderia ubonensis]
MKKVLTYARPAALVLAMALSAAVLVGGATKALPALAQADTVAKSALGLVAFSSAIVLFGWVVYFLALTSIVVAARGWSFFAFAPVSRCHSLGGWLCHSWNFFSVGGQQEGLRVLGFEIALQGHL